MKDTIIHGLPCHNYFAIAVPDTWLFKSIDQEDPRVITLQDPKTKVKTKAEIVDSWTWDIDDFVKMNGFSRLVYGLPATKMAPILKSKYPEIDESQVIRFVLLKKI